MALNVSVLGSGSGGNAVFVRTPGARVLVDAGFSYRSISKRMRAIGEDPTKLDAILVSHEHSDHVVGLPQTIKKTGAPVYLTELTSDSMDWGEKRPEIRTFHAGARLKVGDLEIDTFTIPHDAVDPVGFCVRHGGAKVGLVTDLGYMTESVKHRLTGCDMLMLESNHDVEMLKVGPYPWFVKQRVMSRVGHLSNQSVCDYLASDFDVSTRVLMLAHLSDNNNHPEIARMFADQALRMAGARNTRLLVAEQGAPSEVFEF